MCKLVGETQLILKRFTEPFESRKRIMMRRYHCLYGLDSSEVEVDAPPMGQGETEGREGALGYSYRRVRSLRRNDEEDIMTEIDKKNLNNYLYCTFGITYIAWGLLAMFTQSHILGLETIIGRMLHIVGALGPAIASGFYLKRNNIKFQHFVFSKKENSNLYFIIHLLAILILFSVSSLELNGLSIYLMPLFFIQLIIFGGGHEELGWRGILQPLLDKKYTYWQSNLIVGLIWGIWHLPLWFIVGESHQGFPFILFFVYTLFLSFVLGLLYRQTKSVGYCILFHAFANLLNLYFVLKINLIFIIIFIGYLIYTILASNRISKETTF